MDIKNFDNYFIDKNKNKKYGVPENFNWIAYKSLNTDLKKINSYTDAVKHYKQHGHKQDRTISFSKLIKTKSTHDIINSVHSLEKIKYIKNIEKEYDKISKAYIKLEK